MLVDQHEGHAKCQPRTVYAVSVASHAGKTAALCKKVDELLEALGQVAKGIAALATGPWSGRATQSDAATPVGSVQGACAKKPASKGATRTQGASMGRLDVEVAFGTVPIRQIHVRSASS